MTRRYRRKAKEVNYWMSYSDLMSAMLMVFALLLLSIILNYKEDLAQKEEQIAEVTSIKNEIIEALVSEFEGSNVQIEVDKQTGAIRFASNVLYDFNSAELSVKGKQQLREFIPKYFGILLQERFRDEISNIIIEGHADHEGGYLINLNLSQDRAFSVVQEIYSSKFPEFPTKELSQKYVTANGRSNTVPLNGPDGKYSPEESRRVEFLFRLREEERMDEIQKLVNQDAD